MKIQEQGQEAEFEIPWENILTSLEDGVIVVDRLGKVFFVNQAAEMLTQMPASQALRRPCSLLFRKSGWLIDMVKKSQSPQHSGTRGEGDLATPWGRQVPVSQTVSPLQDRYGRFLGSILLLHDLTRRREMEEDLKRADGARGGGGGPGGAGGGRWGGEGRAGGGTGAREQNPAGRDQGSRAAARARGGRQSFDRSVHR